MFADLLILPPNEKERLLGWRDPNLQAKHHCTVGDFPSVLLSVIEPRMSSRLSAKLTIGEVNSFLTDLYTSVDAEARKGMFRDLIYRASPLEIKWIIKIILKDMKIGVGVESILRHLHPNAIQLYHISNSLQHVLNSISGGNKSSPESPSGQTSIYFQPIKPMLSERVNPGDIPEKFSRMHGSMLLEPKIDGERMLVHVDKRKGSVVIYSRNGVNFTKKYGDNQLSPIILESFKGLGAVFDGEMVAWDHHRGRIHAFGTNREIASGATDAINADTQQNEGDIIGTNGDGNLFYIIFDLIYYVDIDGEQHDLCNTPLEDRRDLLDRVLLPVPHRVEVIKTQRCSGESLVDDIKEFLKKALDKREEGVVVKRANSEYKLNIRGMGWYKIKADYDNMYTDTLDLVVLGGYYSDSFVADSSDNPLDQVTSFLVGVPFVQDNLTRFKTVTKVGTGLTRTQLIYIKNQLKAAALIPFSLSSELPEWFAGWKPSKPNRPDVLFSPWQKETSVVLEVRAGEINYTADFSSGYQLRFPRVVRPRPDKDWTCATTFDELRQIASTDTDKKRIFIQDLTRFERGVGHSGSTSSTREPKRRRGVHNIVIVGGDSTASHRTNTITVDLFGGEEVYVLNGELAVELVDRLGGKVAYMFKRGVTRYCVAESDDVRVKNLVEYEGVAVMNTNWLRECEAERRIATPTHEHILRSKVDNHSE